MNSPLVEIKNLTKLYQVEKKILQALNSITLSIEKGKTLGLVGESGSGKSTLGKCLLRLAEPTMGSIFFNGLEVSTLSQKELKPLRRKMQMIFQDPYASLNPRMTVENIIGEGWEIHNIPQGMHRSEKIEQLLIQVGLEPNMRVRYPKELSGGQRQRVGIARSLALEPEFIVCDEPLSSLDVCVQEQILRLLQNLKKQFNLTYLFISHDLSAVKHLSDQIAVMYLGKIVEKASTADLFEKPLHPYTQILLSAIRFINPEKKKSTVVLKGDIPSPFNIPAGCPFHTRCPKALPICQKVVPPTHEVSAGHFVTCHLINSESRIQNTEFRIQNPEFRIQNSE